MTQTQDAQNGKDAPRILLTPLRSALIAGHAQRLPVLVRIQAPDAPQEHARQRPPYHLALVIDRSGSMSGEPLFEAKRCAWHMVEQMRPDDRVSLVQFDDGVDVLVPATPVGDRTALRRALDGIHEGGSTNLHGGWVAGGRGLLDHVRQAGLSRVILLSDGNANVGVDDPEAIVRHCRQFADQGVSTSTYGLGHSFNEDLMVAMAKGGQGNHYYGETAQDLFEPFAEEFDLLSNLWGRHVHLALGAPAGVRVALLNDYEVEDLRGFPVARMPELAWGAEAWALVELHVPAAPEGAEPVYLLQVEVTAVDLDGNPIAFPEAQLKLPVLSAQTWEALVQDPLVAQRQAELAAGKMLEEARAAARQGDWRRIEQLLDQARQRFADNPWVQQVLQSMAELAARRDVFAFAKEARYSTRRMNSRLTAKDEALSSAQDIGLPSFLRRKSAQGKAQFRRGSGDGGGDGGNNVPPVV